MAFSLGDELSSIFNGPVPFVPNNPPESTQISFQCNDSITMEGIPSMAEPSRRRNTLLGPRTTGRDAKGKSPQVAAKRPKEYVRKSRFSEKKRRDKIKEKLNTLQNLIPNCSKADTVTMLDMALIYLSELKNYVNLCNQNPMMAIAREALMSYPSGPHGAETSTSYGTGIGTGIGTQGYLPPYALPFGYYPPLPMFDQEDGHQP